jgi:hypothetical protein
VPTLSFSALFGLAALAPGPRSGAAEPQKPLRAGAATTNISPWLGLSINGNRLDVKVAHVHDELHARAVVLDDGRTRLAIVVCDSCMIPREVVADAKRLIRERSVLEADHVLISATHSHSCPAATPVWQSDPDEQYRRFLAVRIADAVQGAINNLAPARIGWGIGKDDRQVFNRRWRMKPGTIPPDPFGRTNDRVRTNPPRQSPDLIEPAGPTDPDLPVVSLQSPGGRPIALLANYALHYVGGNGSGHASADYFGMFAERVEDLLKAGRSDPPFVAMMSNGASGDINNVNFREPLKPSPHYARMHAVADELAEEAARVAGAIEYRDGVTLDARATDLRLGVRLPGPEDVARAESVLAKAKGPVMQTAEENYARDTLLMREYPVEVDVTVQALRIGDLGVVAIPCEVFAQIGLMIKAKSPLKPTFTIELANGYNGYLPTKDQHALGGYETWRARSSYLEIEAADRISAKALELLQDLEAARATLRSEVTSGGRGLITR